jgi:DNA-binding MarR family transcriptional regulator
LNSAPLSSCFSLFVEIAKINQLSRTLMDGQLPDGFLTSHFAVLNHLMNVHDGRTPLELASAFQVPKTTMTHTLSGLEKNSLVDFRPNPKDGRSKCVWITNAGRGFRDQAIVKLEPKLTQFLAHLSTDNVSALVTDLANLRKLLDTDRDQDIRSAS